jgi:hypothetical protein
MKAKQQPKKQRRRPQFTKAEVVIPKIKTLENLLLANRHLAQKARNGLS